MRRAPGLLLVLVLGIGLVACSDDRGDDVASDDSSTETTAASADTTAASSETTAGAPAGEPMELDTNGDGKYQIGIATPGPRNDGAYYQAVVDAATEISADRGFGDPVVVDNIQAADAATAIGDLAQQGVDIIIVGASEIAEPLPQLISEYPDIFWYCNCGAGFPEDPGLAALVRAWQRLDDTGRETILRVAEGLAAASERSGR